MDEARDSWKDVGEKVESLGLKLRHHLEQEQDAEVEDRSEGDTKNAFDHLSSEVANAFDAFGNATRDEAVHSDVREIAEMIKQALLHTFHAVGAEIEDLMEKIEDYAEDAAEELAEAMGLDDDDDDDDDADDDDGDEGAPILPASKVQDTLDS